MIIEQFINEKTIQFLRYSNAVINHSLHYKELDSFIENTLVEWTLLEVTDETPNNAKELVFWHVMYEFSIHSAKELESNLYFKSEISTCIDFLSGIGSYPIDCIGWRPIS